MGLTVKIKLLRVLSIIQCWIALWLIVLGIVERARIGWRLSGLGMPIWTGFWVAFTGSFGIFITFKRLKKLCNAFIIPQHLVMTLMGFSLTCGLFCAIIMFWNATELSDAGKKTFRIYTGNSENYRAVNVPFIYDSKHKEEHALIGAIFAFTVVELILAIWSAALCFIDDRQAQLSNYEVPLISPDGQGQGATGAAVLSA